MKRKNTLILAACLLIVVGYRCTSPVHNEEKKEVVKTKQKVPVIYSTDLWSPHGDPDDHFDLATLFSLQNLDIKAVILDNTMASNVKRTGIEKEPNYAVVKKVAALFNRDTVPAAAGLKDSLVSVSDQGLNAPKSEQKAIDLIISKLNSSGDSSVVFITTGSLRDVAAAYNREPNLFNSKVKEFYVSLGDSYGTTGTKDTNVKKDIQAWKLIMNSGMKINWMPTNPSKRRGGISRYVSYWHFVQSEVMLAIPEKARNFFLSEGIPIHIESWQPVRSMWSTPGIIKAASLNCYKIGDDLEWMTAYEANQIPEAKRVEPYEFVPISFSIDETGEITWEEANSGERSSVNIFRMKDYFLYNESMIEFLLDQLKKVE